MTTAPRSVVFLWHMHQPDYRDTPDARGRFVQPWVYLHAMKDYADMAHHLECHPGVHAVVNFSGVLLDQLVDYAKQCETSAWRDPLLQLLAAPERALTTDERLYLGAQCLAIKRETMVRPYPGFAALEQSVATAEHGGPAFWARHEDQTFWDLLTWYHLAWCGESIKRSNTTVQRLMQKAHAFSADDRAALLEVVRGTVCGVLPRYRALANAAQIELSLTPFGHPIAPLLIDPQCARAADPQVLIPSDLTYPGGRERVKWHLNESIRIFETVFGQRPVGMWPAEASVSRELLTLAQAEGFLWIASTESVLRRSLPPDVFGSDSATHAWCVEDAAEPQLFFRQERLSDLFAFEYGQRSPADAVSNFVEQARAMLDASGHQAPVLSIVLDGENAWEHYPDNAYAFFDRLYGALEELDDIGTTTFASASQMATTDRLPDLAAGSWVLDGFSMWIGDERRNRAWNALSALKRCIDGHADELSRGSYDRVLRLLARCESSDWFWWLGMDEPTRAVQAFDDNFRSALAAGYYAIGVAPPAELAQPFSRVGHRAQGTLSVERLAQALADSQGMTLRAQFPEGTAEWTLATHDAPLQALLSDLDTPGWLFAIPDLSALDDDAGGVFKYAEIKIALEKSNQRYFEGFASLQSGRILPGLVVLGADEDQARYLAQRFRLPVVAYGMLGTPGKLIACR